MVARLLELNALINQPVEPRHQREQHQAQGRLSEFLSPRKWTSQNVVDALFLPPRPLSASPKLALEHERSAFFNVIADFRKVLADIHIYTVLWMS